MAFRGNLKRVKKERKHLGDEFEIRINEHCKMLWLPKKNTRAPRRCPKEEAKLARSKLSVSVDDVSSDSELSTGNNNEDKDNTDDDGSNNNDEEDCSNNKGNDDDEDDRSNANNKGNDDDKEDCSDDNNNGKGDDSNGEDEEEGAECEQGGALVGGLNRDDENSKDEDEEPRYVYTQRRKRKRRSCRV